MTTMPVCCLSYSILINIALNLHTYLHIIIIIQGDVKHVPPIGMQTIYELIEFIQKQKTITVTPIDV